MSYKILESRIEFLNSQIKRVTVLVDLTGNQSKPLSDVRAITASTVPRGGYTYIPAGANLTDELLQNVAAAGREVYNVDEIFPEWRTRHLA